MTIRQSTPISPEPSTLAASSTSSGRAEKRRIRIHTPIGRMKAACRSETAHRCPVRLASRKILNTGTTITAPGIIWVSSRMKPNTSLPRQRRRAIAYAPSVASTIVTAVVMSASCVEFQIQVPTGRLWSSWR